LEADLEAIEHTQSKLWLLFGKHSGGHKVAEYSTQSRFSALLTLSMKIVDTEHDEIRQNCTSKQQKNEPPLIFENAYLAL
jgi:hypothetical protein